MSKEDTEYTDDFIIPQNAIRVNEFLGIKWTRWIEAVIFTLLAAALISLIPFVIRVQIIVTIVVCAAVFAATLYGIHGRTITSFIYLHILNKFKRVEYHLGSIYDNRKAANAAMFAGKSGIERIVDRLRAIDKTLEERYGVDDAKEIREDNEEEQ